MSPRQRRAGGGSVLWTLFLYELRMLVRDTRTLLIAVAAPLVIFPIMILVSRTVERRDQAQIEQATYRYAVIGTEVASFPVAVTCPGTGCNSRTYPARDQDGAEACAEASDPTCEVEGDACP